jgi:hypothetical protein
MPKRYRIEMTLIDEASNTQLEPTDTDKVTYEDDAEAKAKFADKKKAAHDAGKGRPA